ncbi:MAG: hypothetical protein L0H55_07150 [Candidatus Nitrosocosmicus sp.]|nr:hypothetical protein [Candidatus Nitrosocosmicus sp.]
MPLEQTDQIWYKLAYMPTLPTPILLAPRSEPNRLEKVESAFKEEEQHNTRWRRNVSFIGSGNRLGMSFDNKYNSFLFSKNLI